MTPMGTAKLCRKCLLKEEFPDDYEKYVASLIKRMPLKEKVTEELYQARLERCKQCDKLQNGTCMACGCMVEIRGIQRGKRCPYGYW